MPDRLPTKVLQQFEEITGRAGMVTDADLLAPHLTEWRGLYQGRAPLMLRPASVDEVAKIIGVCQAERIGVVPQGGNTGLVGGAIPRSMPESPQVLLSLSRLNRIRELDSHNYTITADAGCVLAQVQEAAVASDCYFPLSLAAEGSCQLGGNISTNAGGTNVLRYGNTRDLVLGLEVVLPDGRIFSGLRGLRKDNTGYDLKQLFIGAEGTLGVITAATLKLFPRPQSIATALIAVADPDAAIGVYSRARAALGDQLSAFELINRLAIDLVLAHIPGTREPLAGPHDWYVLLEMGSPRAGDDADRVLEAYLAESIEAGVIIDGVLAKNEAERDALWRIRHSISEAQKIDGAGIKHDISVPVSRVADFLRQVESFVNNRIPGVLVVAFGHLGDGNIHFNLNQPPNMEADTFLEFWTEISREVHTVAVDLGGSFSAEHGIGVLKSDELARLRDPVELDLMRAVKRALDPAGIMNPGKIFGQSD